MARVEGVRGGTNIPAGPTTSRRGAHLPAGQEAAEAFYRVVDAAYELRSVAVTSNLHPSGFDTIMPRTLATATVDWLLHHAHVVLTGGS